MKSLSTVILSIIGMDIVPSIIDVWGYDREFCSSSSPSPSCVTQTPKKTQSDEILQEFRYPQCDEAAHIYIWVSNFISSKQQ